MNLDQALKGENCYLLIMISGDIIVNNKTSPMSQLNKINCDL